MWLKTLQKLKEKGVLSINQRNQDFILPYNPRKNYPLVDNKLKTKKLALAAGIAVPRLYEVVESEHQIKYLEDLLKPYKDFVVKPAHGAGGDGIMVFTGRVFGHYRQINGKLISADELRYHLSLLLSGAFSLGGHEDIAIIEHRVEVSPVFQNISYEGVPDVRVITLLGYPAMAMARLPTRLSGGKANLHQGAIGVGVDLATGKTFGGVFRNDAIDYHPDTLNSVEGIEVPYWQEILQIAASCYELTNLGYLGVDIVLDKIHGPLMLELNARPGLNIQIANRKGSLPRYRKIEARAAQIKESAEKRVAFSQQHFGSGR